MPDYLKQGAFCVQFGKTSWQQAPGMTLRMGQVGIVDAAAAGALEFTTDRAD